ncbi:hypothetical protein [Hymenobacter negativus]|uniref:Uncharacterized protein n=1 Tax=Hymenobacter negativus TaxID=2795026 RepID=A0ABS3QLD9_9BACT|nr:hypothetical protein [Hymenobacter negativus]MBO2011574.1 hypothetical protein [Hymenobacter negativus]
MSPTSFALFARAGSARWRRWLRRSVRLYLAMDEPLVDKQRVKDQLVLVEWQLVRHLVDGDVPTMAVTTQARDIVDMAQANLLGSETEVRALRREMSARQAVSPWNCHYPNMAA